MKDNEYTKNQIIINPNIKASEVLDRNVKIILAAKVDENLEWKFEPLEEGQKQTLGDIIDAAKKKLDGLDHFESF